MRTTVIIIQGLRYLQIKKTLNFLAVFTFLLLVFNYNLVTFYFRCFCAAPVSSSSCIDQINWIRCKAMYTTKVYDSLNALRVWRSVVAKVDVLAGAQHLDDVIAASGLWSALGSQFDIRPWFHVKELSSKYAISYECCSTRFDSAPRYASHGEPEYLSLSGVGRQLVKVGGQLARCHDAGCPFEDHYLRGKMYFMSTFVVTETHIFISSYCTVFLCSMFYTYKLLLSFTWLI